MKKRTLVLSITSGLLLLGLMGSAAKPTTPQTDSIQPAATTSKVAPVEQEVKNEVKSKPATCNGTDITSSCVVGDVAYKTYVYHEAVPEKTRQETTTTYKDEIASYCTLCNDGTYSPSCATGRGACSHHGGVAEWNAPRYRKVPVESTRTIVESPAKEAYYEKVVQE